MSGAVKQLPKYVFPLISTCLTCTETKGQGRSLPRNYRFVNCVHYNLETEENAMTIYELLPGTFWRMPFTAKILGLLEVQSTSRLGTCTGQKWQLLVSKPLVIPSLNGPKALSH